MHFYCRRLTLPGDFRRNDVIILAEKCNLTDFPTTDVFHFRSVGIFEGGFLSDPTSSRRWPTFLRWLRGEGMPRSMLNSIGNTFTAVFYK